MVYYSVIGRIFTGTANYFRTNIHVCNAKTSNVLKYNTYRKFDCVQCLNRVFRTTVMQYEKKKNGFYYYILL